MRSPIVHNDSNFSICIWCIDGRKSDNTDGFVCYDCLLYGNIDFESYIFQFFERIMEIETSDYQYDFYCDSILSAMSVLGSKFGIIDVITGLCILNLSGLMLNKIQFDKVINDRASGIGINGVIGLSAYTC